MEPIASQITRWSLERLRFMLTHLEDFIEDDVQNKNIRDQAIQFSSQTGLDKIENLTGALVQDPHLSEKVLESLIPFFDAGLLLQRISANQDSNWWVTDLFWRGNLFHLELKDQIQATRLVPEIAPLQVNRALAKGYLGSMGLDFLVSRSDTDAFLLKPTPSVGYLLMTELAPPWCVDHIQHTQRLINKCFVY